MFVKHHRKKYNGFLNLQVVLFLLFIQHFISEFSTYFTCLMTICVFVVNLCFCNGPLFPRSLFSHV